LPYGDNTHFIALPKKNTSERKDIFRWYYWS
jgi:hypothetical protein